MRLAIYTILFLFFVMLFSMTVNAQYPSVESQLVMLQERDLPWQAPIIRWASVSYSDRYALADMNVDVSEDPEWGYFYLNVTRINEVIRSYCGLSEFKCIWPMSLFFVSHIEYTILSRASTSYCIRRRTPGLLLHRMVDITDEMRYLVDTYRNVDRFITEWWSQQSGRPCG